MSSRLLPAITAAGLAFSATTTQASDDLEIVASVTPAPGNITVTSDNRIFVSLHQLYQPPMAVAEAPRGAAPEGYATEAPPPRAATTAHVPLETARPSDSTLQIPPGQLHPEFPGAAAAPDTTGAPATTFEGPSERGPDVIAAEVGGEGPGDPSK